jgi:hypothetical protein
MWQQDEEEDDSDDDEPPGIVVPQAHRHTYVGQQLNNAAGACCASRVVVGGWRMQQHAAWLAQNSATWRLPVSVACIPSSSQSSSKLHPPTASASCKLLTTPHQNCLQE